MFSHMFFFFSLILFAYCPGCRASLLSKHSVTKTVKEKIVAWLEKYAKMYKM